MGALSVAQVTKDALCMRLFEKYVLFLRGVEGLCQLSLTNVEYTGNSESASAVGRHRV